MGRISFEKIAPLLPRSCLILRVNILRPFNAGPRTPSRRFAPQIQQMLCRQR